LELGYFQGKKGLSKDILSLLTFFVLAMKVLSRLLEVSALDHPDFRFHPKCSSFKFSHLCFADDLLIFSAANLSSLKVINDVLVEFEELSGLKSNHAKSSLFLAGVPSAAKGALLDFLQVSEGFLLVRYLGVPLISKRLATVDCEGLMAKITNKIDSWLVKHLFFASRLQLISSVLYSL
jgi:hypothetical protein